MTQAALDQQVARLVAAFVDVSTTRMQGVPVLNPALAVEAVDFEMIGQEPHAALGILITPWFMNLVWLPMQQQATLPVGQMALRRLGDTDFEFIGAHEPAFGDYEMCSLFSPMFEFAGQDAARATARQVLAQLRREAPPRPAASSHARRAFLFGRPRERT